MTNAFKKITTGVYGLHSENKDLNHGDMVTITTRHGKEVAATVWKRVGLDGKGGAFYSIVREDGKNRTQFLKNKAEKRKAQAERQQAKAAHYYERSRKDKDFLVLGEPIKVGHHSERRHRKAIDDAYNNMGKSVEMSEKADRTLDIARELEEAADKQINIDVPDCIEPLQQRIKDLEEVKEVYKKEKAPHFCKTNLAAKIRRYKKRLELAQWLWDLDYVRIAKKTAKKESIDDIVAKYEGFFAFNQKQLDEQIGQRDKSDFIHFGAGLIIPKVHLEAFKKDFKKL